MFFSNKKRLHSSSHNRNKKRLLKLRFIAFTGSFLVLTVLFSWLAHQNTIRISKVSIQGSSFLKESFIAERVWANLLGTYALLFPRNVNILYPKHAIREDLLDEFPQVADVSLSLGGLTSLKIELNERVPYALWCGDGKHDDKSLNQKKFPDCFFVDNKGVIFLDAPIYSHKIFFEIYGGIQGGKVRDGSTQPKPLGHAVLPEQSFKYISSFKKELEHIGISPTRLHIEEKERRHFELKNKVLIFFSEKFSTDELVENIETALRSGVINLLDISSDDSSLEYLDLRFKNKVYYKFKSKEATVQTIVN